MNGLLLAKGKQRNVITYVAIKLLKASFYNNFHVTTTLPPSITYQHLQMWPAKESASKKSADRTLIQNASDVHHLFCASVLDEVLGYTLKNYFS